jgi:predicted N-acyltransferase
VSLGELSLVFADSMAEIGEGSWKELEGPADFPFLRFEWLAAFERSGTVGGATGWLPRHVRIVTASGDTVAVAPAYVKSHSMGEFVFDQSFAEFAEARLGVRYYPKLVLAVPFTPATGPRLLFRRGLVSLDRARIWDLVASTLPERAAALGLGSVHVLFPDDEQADALAARGWASRLGVQFQYHRGEQRTFGDYLASFPSKRRTAIRRERRSLEEGGIEIQSLTGGALSGSGLGAERARLAHELYLTTVDKYVWGRRYLNLPFFQAVFEGMPDAVQLVLAARSGGEILGGALNLIGRHALYGRYWGSLCDVPFLHFNVCLYRGIEETLRLELASFQPGAGGEHKEGRGFAATPTRSLHWFEDARLDRAVREYLVRERDAVTERIAGRMDE